MNNITCKITEQNYQMALSVAALLKLNFILPITLKLVVFSIVLHLTFRYRVKLNETVF